MIGTRHCSYHHGDVSARSAEQVDATAAITGPGKPIYACLVCIRSLGLVPVRHEAFVGRPDRVPILPGRSA